MVYDAAGPHFFSAHLNPEPVGACSSFPTNGSEAGPSSYSYDVSRLSDRFFDVVRAADQPLYNGCDESQLSAVARLVNIKAENNMSERCYDQVSQWASDLLPRDHTLPPDYYNTKKLIRDLGLPIEKIHACKNGCMLYWKDDIGLEYCKFCGDPRYKPTKDRNPQRKKSPYAVLRYLPLIPRLQRLYASPATAKYMTWHACHQTKEGSMCHPSDVEAWRHFDKSYPDFAVEPHNVRLALCTDGFAPHGQYGRTYSCWPVILTPYNFPPGMCMKPEYMFLMMVIPGPSNPKRCIDIYLEPLIKELLQLWHVGVLTHDHATNQALMMRAALMWTINDLPAYGMASGWSTAGIMGCPVCMEDTQAFRLQHGRKACYFDCHRQFLPHDHPYRRNKRSFTKNRQERKIARPRLTGDEIHRRVEQYGTAVEEPLTYPSGYGNVHKWTKKSIFWDLPY
ncbi:UNVERIFIED_CONTAM: hypothetical protein Sradi_0667900 [Sesamum radiatum]|uniref:Uncharacterized protein n=1 Tax=Sesamum radiatum TaxID=300843 RepID=A0AAW2VKT3_SESRA